LTLFLEVSLEVQRKNKVCGDLTQAKLGAGDWSKIGAKKGEMQDRETDRVMDVMVRNVWCIRRREEN